MKKRYKIPIIFLLFIVIILAVSFIFIQNYLNKMNIVDHNDVEMISPEDETFEVDDNQDESLVEVDPNEVKWPDMEKNILDGKDIVNILLIGQDKRGETRQRSDTMILVTINKTENSIKLTSFMRDLYVQIPGYSDNRMNAAYQLGGMPLLNQVLETNFGIHVDGNIEVDFESFKTLVDLVGGVDVELSQDEADYLCGIKRDVVYPQKYRPDWNLSEGINTLNGEQALLHARNRSIGHSDYERTERQREVLVSLFNKAKSSDFNTVLSLADEGFSMLTTDMTHGQVMGYLFNILTMGIDSVETYRIPQDGAYYSARIRGMAVLVPYLDQCRAYLQDVL